MAWCKSNDKHIYAKNGIDNRHIYVSEIANEKYIDRFLLYCKTSVSENEEDGGKNFTLYR